MISRNNFWWKNAVIYEVYVDKFAGNFRGMAEKLPYLKNLGINCIWILPHYPSPMVDDGYDVSDYMNVRPELGTLDDFRMFTKKAHEMGIRVIVDLVLNHVSIEHPWFKERRDYFLWSKTGKEFPQAVNPFFHLKPSNWIPSRSLASGTLQKPGFWEEYYFATFYPQQADLNWDNPEVFNEMMKVVDFWMGMGVDPVRSKTPIGASADMPSASRTSNGVDGFRLDAAPFLIKREGTNCVNLPETHAVLKKIRTHIEARDPEVILLAEANGPLNKVKEYFGSTSLTTGGGDECHMVFHFHLMSAMFLALKRANGSIVQNLIKNSFNIPDNCQWATFLRNHDELTLEHVSPARREELLKWLDPVRSKTPLGASADMPLARRTSYGVDPEEKYSFKGGHGASVRLATIFKGDKDKILEAFELLFSLPGSPVIYYGDEIGMENLQLSEKPADSRKYIRGDFDWPEVEKQLNESDSLLIQIKKLLKERENSKV